jgi:hypothetical protein
MPSAWVKSELNGSIVLMTPPTSRKPIEVRLVG